MDAITREGHTSSPLVPKPEPVHSRNSSVDAPTISPPVPAPVKVSLSSAAPPVGTPLSAAVGATDKEREKLLYPGRVNLTSELFIQLVPVEWKSVLPE